MKIVFIHQNFPGQYKYLAPHLAAKPGNEIVAIAKAGRSAPPNIRLLPYRPRREAAAQTHPYLKRFEDAVLHGEQVAACLVKLKREGFVPDVVIGHPGWGETLFVKDVFADTPILSYCEFYYRPHGSDADFDPDKAVTLEDSCRCRINDSHHLLAIEAAERGVAPTHWQRNQFPQLVRDKISVIHDGIDVEAIRPDPEARVTLPDGTVLTRKDEVVTYVARNFEPHRGFATLMRGVAESCRRRPNCHYLLVGGDEVSYGVRLPAGETHRERLLAEVTVDPRRVHFLGKIPYASFLDVLKVSAAHIYLTQPFVLSWSVLEAMAAGCVVIASDTAPVREVIRTGENGLLFDFFAPHELADRIDEVLGARENYEDMRRLARKTIVNRFALADSLRKLEALITGLATKSKPRELKFDKSRTSDRPAAHAS